MARELTAVAARLDYSARAALERAARNAAAGTGTLGVADLVAALVLDGEVVRIVERLGLSAAALSPVATPASGAGPGGVPTPTLGLLQVLEAAVDYAHVLGLVTLGAGELFVALIDDATARAVAVSAVPLLARIPRGMAGRVLDRVRGTASALTAATAFGASVPAPADVRSAAHDAPREPPSSTRDREAVVRAVASEALERFTVDLTDAARRGQIDPVHGREREIRQLVDVLSRRRQNNPVLVGEAGVGKTAVVEGLALRIAAGEVPPGMHDVAVRALDLGLLRAGANLQGEFEERLRALVDAVEGAQGKVILFIDEVHTLIGAGGRAGTQDAANLLKPALARGSLRAVGATTWQEYKRHVESDPALARRFHPVAVDEPSPEAAEAMLRSIAKRFEAHHGVRVLDDAVVAAVRLAVRYLPERRLPDKAVSVLDTAAARVAVAQRSVPDPILAVRSRIVAVEDEIDALTRELGIGRDHAERISVLYAELDRVEATHQRLVDQWEHERSDAGAAPRDGAGRATRLVPVHVDVDAVAAVVADWAHVPLERITESESRSTSALPQRLERRVLGQELAVRRLAQAAATVRAGFQAPGRPAAVLVLVGPAGTGKTTAATALGALVTGQRDSVVTLVGSDFREAHSVASLRGAPPGYLGFGAGGLLTEALRRRPDSFVVFDDADSAHPDVLAMLRGIVTTGRLEDAEGLVVSFEHAWLVLCVTATLTGSALAVDARRAGRQVLPASLVDGAVVVPFAALTRAALEAIVDGELRRLQVLTRERHGVELVFSAGVAAMIVSATEDVTAGARPAIAFVRDTLVPALAELTTQRPAAVALLPDRLQVIRAVACSSLAEADGLVDDG